jgi:hypothetical protein
MDSTVQSIQVASALIERVAVLMRPDNSLRHALGGHTDIGEMELRLGEAQQTMPEIWNHLGEARNAIAATGVDVGAYDQIRGQLRTQLASTDIEVKQNYGWDGSREIVKTVKWDVDGLHRAIAARDVLRRLRPEVDWVGMERQQAQELAAIGGLGGAKWVGLVKVSVALAVVLAVVWAIKSAMN